MNTIHRPTTLKYFLDNCPAAVDHYESGIAEDRSIFAVGTAAHEVLQANAEGRSVPDLVAQLISTGRSGDDAEGPLPVDAVLHGRDLALAFVDRYPVPDAALFERRYAFNAEWEPCEWNDPACWFRTRIDVDYELVEGGETEDDPDLLIGVIDDYKSSWQATEVELDTLQRKAQAVCKYLTTPGLYAIRMRISNLRRLWRFDRDIVLDDAGVALLEQWKADLDAACRAVDASLVNGKRPARPGAGCMKCSFARSCPASLAYFARVAEKDPDTIQAPEDTARAWMVAKGHTAILERAVRARTVEGAIVVDGRRVGPIPKDRRYPDERLGLDAELAFLEALGVPVDASLKNALGSWHARLGAPSVGASEVMARALFPGRHQVAERAAWLEERMSRRVSPEFGVANGNDDALRVTE